MRTPVDSGVDPVAAGDGETPAASVEPSWDGREGSIGYLTKMFPRASETFVLREILTLRSRGLPLRIYSLLPPMRDAVVQTEAAALVPEVIVLPQPSWRTLRSIARALGRCLAAQPAATLRECLKVLVWPSARRWRKLARALLLAESLRQERIAHLHAAWAHTPASVARLAARLTGVPWSMSAHAKDIFLSRRSSLAKKVRSARFTLACTRTHRDLLVELAGPADAAPAPRVELLYHGVDVDRFRPAGHPRPADPEESRLLSVGRLVPKKGFDVLLDAAALLRDRGIRFRLEIIGEGPQRPALTARIGRLGLEERVELRGLQPLEEVRRAYARADAFVLASRITAEGDRDGIANTLAEAMACELPVVTTSLPSAAELVTDGLEGFLVAPEDPRALAEALATLLADPALRRLMGERGHMRVGHSFDARVWGRRAARRFAGATGIQRVLYISADRGVPARGAKGASVHLRAVARALGDEGCAVRLLTGEAGPGGGPEPAAPWSQARASARVERSVRRAARLMRGGHPLERALLRLLDNVAIERAGQRLGQTWRPDLIYERYALTALAGARLARAWRVPLVLEVNAPLAEEEARFRGLRLGWLARTLERRLWRRADVLVVVSRALAERARRSGVPAARILVLPNGVDPALFHPARDGSEVRRQLGLNGQFVIGFSGTLKPWHGLEHLVEALPRIVAEVPEAALLLIGEGPERESLTRRAAELGVPGHLHLAGSVGHAEVGAYLAASDVLVAPYGEMEDHWFSPLKVAEYRAAGRAVVASAVGQLAESPGEEAGLLLTPPGDEAALAQALISLARDPQRRAALGRAGAASSDWTWARVARAMLARSEAARRTIWRWSDAG